MLVEIRLRQSPHPTDSPDVHQDAHLERHVFRYSLVGVDEFSKHPGLGDDVHRTVKISNHTYLGSTNLLVNNIGNVRGKCNQRCSSIDSSSGVLELKDLVSKGELLKLDLPVSLSSDGGVVDLALVVCLVDTSKDGFSSLSVYKAASISMSVISLSSI